MMMTSPASYAPNSTDFSLSSIETHTTASTDPHRTDRIIGNAYKRCVLMTSYGMRTMRVYGRLALIILQLADYLKASLSNIPTYQ
ncbi:hypothetical protein SFRURICE_017939 [Spodoptera frugiperda]|nr:hypothetical protein SFRURICE_017939 [Spodoptera frugiperda]